MKKILFLSLIISLIIGSCAQQEKKSPIEGTQKMVYGDWSSYNMKDTYPAQVKGGQIKIYTKSYFSYVGEFKLDTTESMNTGCGTYTSEGNKFEETILYRKGETGKKTRALYDVRNDSLIIRWPADENWKLEEKFSIEKYIRLE